MLTVRQAVEMMLSEDERNDPYRDSAARRREYTRLIIALKTGEIQGANNQNGRLWLIPEDSFAEYLKNPS